MNKEYISFIYKQNHINSFYILTKYIKVAKMKDIKFQDLHKNYKYSKYSFKTLEGNFKKHEIY